MQRFLLAAVLVGSAVGFWYGSYDVFHTFKATIVVAGALLVAAVSAARVAVTRQLVLPATWVWAPVAGFVLALVVAAAVSETPLRAMVGRPGRHTGLVPYLAYVGLFAAAVRLHRDHSPVALVKSLLVAAVPISVYGIWQAAGFDPLRWTAVVGGPPSTFGNTNFFSAWLGIVLPLFVWAALSRRLSGEWRAWSSVLGVLALVAAVASRSLQGPLVALLGSLVVVGVWLANRRAEGDRRLLARLPPATAVVVAVMVLCAGALAAASLTGAHLDAARSLSLRVPMWSTALAMFAARPLTGVGLDGYGEWFYRYRPETWATGAGADIYSDSAHSVPLDMLANGGLLLVATYLAVVAATAWALVAGLRRLRGEDRLLLAGLGGAWVAYHAQALGSIDVPPLAAAHWVLAGLVVARGAAPRLRVLILADPGGRGPPLWRRPGDVALLAGVTAVTVAALALVALPLRADIVALRAELEPDPDQAIRLYQEASATARWEPLYPRLAGVFLAGQDDPAGALGWYEAAVARNRRDFAAHLALARVAAELGRDEQAAQAYGRVLAIDPKTPGVLAEVRAFRLEEAARKASGARHTWAAHAPSDVHGCGSCVRARPGQAGGRGHWVEVVRKGNRWTEDPYAPVAASPLHAVRPAAADLAAARRPSGR